MDNLPPGSLPQHVLEEIESQLLKSDLYDSTIQDTGVPPAISNMETTTRISGPPVLVEIKDLTDVGISAFQLEQVRKAREERIQTLMRRNGGQPVQVEEDMEGDGGDLEIEGDEGPMPKYPRGTLMFHLSDGFTTFKAMEYKPLPQLSLLTTPLGFKMQLKDVKVVKGVAHLEPINTFLKGGNSVENARKDFQFKQGLRRRLGLDPEEEPQPAEDQAPGDIPAPIPSPQAVRRTSLQEIVPPSPPPAVQWSNEDANLEDKRRRVPNTSSTILSSASVSRTTATATVTSQYFNNNGAPSSSSRAIGMALSPTLRQTAPTLPKPVTPGSSPGGGFEDDFDWEALDQIEQEALASNPPVRPSAPSNISKVPTSQVHQETIEIDDDYPMSQDENEEPTLLTRQPKPSAVTSVLERPPVFGEPLELVPDIQDTFVSDLPTDKGNLNDTRMEADIFDDEFDDFPILDSEDLRELEEVERRTAAFIDQHNSATAATRTTKTIIAADLAASAKKNKRDGSKSKSASSCSPSKHPEASPSKSKSKTLPTSASSHTLANSSSPIRASRRETATSSPTKPRSRPPPSSQRRVPPPSWRQSQPQSSEVIAISDSDEDDKSTASIQVLDVAPEMPFPLSQFERQSQSQPKGRGHARVGSKAGNSSNANTRTGPSRVPSTTRPTTSPAKTSSSRPASRPRPKSPEIVDLLDTTSHDSSGDEDVRPHMPVDLHPTIPRTRNVTARNVRQTQTLSRAVEEVEIEGEDGGEDTKENKSVPRRRVRPRRMSFSRSPTPSNDEDSDDIDFDAMVVSGLRTRTKGRTAEHTMSGRKLTKSQKRREGERNNDDERGVNERPSRSKPQSQRTRMAVEPAEVYEISD
ncbi:hypothetical protein CC1G_06376 [Coprinopsis cinerea okayama7|uniref:RecQ-mediated genome instability protein 1 n=1 Tax=Coprinopsis cinerea (strain Okayama-7 / 130 / ATCC MYA-4618 / FGSC 9003) TaxID=240176 RepID=A8NTS3_COPC7|nr:hypothetical protein CC1G_06376 [Coprinopsis cinerea okayama7\|eukprot:XP_001836291.2 hypothetical protein CC1G_06376 [Coprinopsis cinerea okayama7\